MTLPQFWRRPFGKARVHPKVTHATEPASRKTKRSKHPEEPQTARNALKLALETLRTISATIPMGSALSGVIDSMLAVTNRIEQCSANTHGFIQIAARIEHIMGILSETPNQGLLDELHEELQSIMADLEVASSLGKLDQFFNTTQNASCIAKHNARLTQIICTTATINTFEILKSIQDLELKIKHANDAQLDITGGLGGAGGPGRFGGQGGRGGGPKIDLRPRLKFRHISGGTGGAGGAGVDVGGTGGTGEGPEIRSTGFF
ncbi:hypothetical protein B0H13DRAFT_1971246 [Mycena leptocephala]|nr:hypothetical protein B0H13DRAFT_1971246 [Mycena leptocephala]